MKKWLTVAMMFRMCQMAEAAAYIEAQAGAVPNPQAAFGIRGGQELDNWDFSIGYWTTRDAPLDDSRLIAKSMDANTFDGEVYRIFPMNGKVRARVGGGIGYTMLDLSGPDKADNDVSYVAGGGLDYKISDHVVIGLLVRGFFFNTKTHRTTYGSHVETLSNGQNVEVVDQFESNDSVNFNNVLYTVGVKYLF